ncbi:methionine--tRNA ligase [Patescibacteria group bacterium]
MNKKFYVTTAIDYTNDVVHIGHSYQKILADVLARYHRLIGHQTHYLTGTDEHGQKVEKSAQKAKIEPKKFVDKIAAADKAEWDKLNVSYDRFIRTTDQDHVSFAQEIYLKSKKAGDIYLGEYDGLYCESCETYLTESDLKDNKCPFHPQKSLLKIKEKNYFFRLSKYQKFLENLLEKNPKFVVPESKRKETLSFIKSGLRDFAVSRPNIKWGIPVPDDPGQTIYVWFDALINYLTYGTQKNCWPADVHVLGKDNLRFHAIYWPAMLKSAGYELPKTILIHDFISLNGQKISKSLGNIIKPSELVTKLGPDPVRYYFLRHGPLRNDIDFTLEKINEIYNADLANGLGNLVARVAKLCENSDLQFNNQQAQKIYPQVKESFNEFRPDKALEFLWQEKITGADKIIDREKAWQLKNKKLEIVLQKLVNVIRQIAFNLKPFLPETAEKIEKQFAGPKIKAEKPLFPRLEKPASDQLNQVTHDQVVIGKIVDLFPHPKADKLKVAKVNINQPKELTIVCGGPNLKKGQIVPIALPGSKINTPNIKNVKVKKTNIRGVKSEGIICSELEVGRGKEYDAIWELPEKYDKSLGQPLSIINAH